MKTKLTEKIIQKRLNSFLATWKYNVDGLYVFPWESDKLIWTKAGLIYEFEIKISRADYKADFKHKPEKHLLLNSLLPDNKSKYIEGELFNQLKKKQQKKFPRISLADTHLKYRYPPDTPTPNYFYYAVPEGMLEPEEIPPYAGLIYIAEEKGVGTGVYIVREAPKLHKTKYGDGELNLAEKFYYNMVSWRSKYRKQVDYSLMYRNRLADELASKGQERSYKEMEDDLKCEKDNAASWEETASHFKHLYLTMVKGADYNSIERRMLIDEIQKYNPQFEYIGFLKEVDKKYEERYPDRAERKITVK